MRGKIEGQINCALGFTAAPIPDEVAFLNPYALTLRLTGDFFDNAPRFGSFGWTREQTRSKRHEYGDAEPGWIVEFAQIRLAERGLSRA